VTRGELHRLATKILEEKARGTGLVTGVCVFFDPKDKIPRLQMSLTRAEDDFTVVYHGRLDEILAGPPAAKIAEACKNLLQAATNPGNGKVNL
jgi:hypothetical protein